MNWSTFREQYKTARADPGDKQALNLALFGGKAGIIVYESNQMTVEQWTGPQNKM
jgi:hypothetical protein